MQECASTLVNFSIADDETKGAAAVLLNERYGTVGYGDQSLPTEGVTFIAEIEDIIVATVTLVVEDDRAVLTRLASSIKSYKVLEGLFRMAYVHGTDRYDCDYLYIEVHPRHIRFYERMFKFELFGESWFDPCTNSPSQMMRLKVDSISI